MTTSPSGFCRSEPTFTEKHIGRDADRAGEAFADLLAQRPLELERQGAGDRHLPLIARQAARHLVNRHHLLDRHAGVDGGQHALVVLGVESVPRLHRDHGRANLLRLAHERAGGDTEALGLVAGSDRTGGIRRRLHDDDRLPAQGRIVLLLARREESVEVEEQPLDEGIGCRNVHILFWALIGKMASGTGFDDIHCAVNICISLNVSELWLYSLCRREKRVAMLNAETTERQLVGQFLDVVRGLPEVRAELERRDPGAGTDGRYDAQVDLRVGGKSVTVLIEAKKTLYPRDVRQALWQLREYSREWRKGPKSRPPVPMLVAEAISPGAKQLLRDEGVGYYDSGGSLFLPGDGVYLYIDKPPAASLTKSMRSLFSGRRAQVLHALLLERGQWFKVRALAEQALVSPATASQVLTELERLDWVVARGQGPGKERQLREPAALLDAWVKQLAAARPAPMRRFFVPSVAGDALVEKVGQVFAQDGIEYAITHEAAGQRYAPFLSSVSQVRCRVVNGPAVERALAEIGARAVSEGANLAVIEAKSSGELLFRELTDGVWLASPIQVYLDLVGSEGRGKEMAEHLRRERLGF
jgi:hypothetical protein